VAKKEEKLAELHEIVALKRAPALTYIHVALSGTTFPVKESEWKRKNTSVNDEVVVRF
jgi:hypothetical protein